jgi:hypothetical protein
MTHTEIRPPAGARAIVCFMATRRTAERRQSIQIRNFERIKLLVGDMGLEIVCQNSGNSTPSPSALQSALQIDAARLVEAIGRLSPEERAAVLRALAVKATK